MSEVISLTPPLSDQDAQGLKIGDMVSFNGVIYTARDAAHKRLVELIEKGDELPFDVAGAVIYYVGPTPAKPGEVIGSAGPTTSYRMDPYAPKLIELGLEKAAHELYLDENTPCRRRTKANETGTGSWWAW